jgi:hypothetical protein
MERNPDPGSGINMSGHISDSVADPDLGLMCADVELKETARIGLKAYPGCHTKLTMFSFGTKYICPNFVSYLVVL